MPVSKSMFIGFLSLVWDPIFESHVFLFLMTLIRTRNRQVTNWGFQGIDEQIATFSFLSEVPTKKNLMIHNGGTFVCGFLSSENTASAFKWPVGMLAENSGSLLGFHLPGTPRPTIYKWMEMVISNHFLCKDWVHHPIDGQP